MKGVARHMLRAAKRLLFLLLNLTVYPLSGLFPRSPKQWVFGHTRDLFAGNPKYLFLWMTIHRPDIRVSWISGSRATQRLLAKSGYRAHLRWSPAGILAALRAGAFLYAHGVDNVNAQLSRGALLVNLWHGVGLKAVHLGHKTGMTNQASNRMSSWFGRLGNFDRLLGYDTVVTTSDLMQSHFAHQFRIAPERCPQLGYPRLDTVLDPALDQAARDLDSQAGFDFNSEGFREVYIYMPTFRDTGRPFLAEAIPDFDRLSAALAAREALLYLKLHLRTDDPLPTGHANIRAWPDAFDFQTYLPSFTGLITDYSSVLYDFLFVHRAGTILYTFDFDDYVSKERDLLYPFEENVAGLRVANFEALCHAIEQGTALVPDPRVDAIRDRFWGRSPRPASPAIVAYVEGRLKAGDL
jgi:CDP-glycerol glycerophosphotransferase (TagB/SpsB family)